MAKDDVEESRIQSYENPDDVPPEVLVAEIRRGSARAEDLFYRKYVKGLILMLERRMGDRARAEDLAQDALMTVLERLRTTGSDKPESLGSFLHQTAKYQFIGWLRKSVNQTEWKASVEDHAEETTAVEDDLDRERAREQVRILISEMKVARDRELLYRFYVRDQAKPVICEALDLSPTHFDRVINRARNRFKELLLAQVAE